MVNSGHFDGNVSKNTSIYKQDEEFGSEKKKKVEKRDSKYSEVEDLQKKFMGKEDSNEGSSVDSDDADLFSVPMNSEAFMAKIKEQQKKIMQK